MPKINYIALNLKNEFIKNLSNIIDDMKILLNNNGYDFYPMSEDTLHMTLVFLGNILSKNTKAKMNKVEDKIKLFEQQFNNLVLEFDSFELFPTSKRNLIVAKFKLVNTYTNANTNTNINNHQQFITDMISYKKSFVEIGAKEENYFTPHITLGKITNLKPNNNISSLFPSFDSTISNINIDGCHLV